MNGLSKQSFSNKRFISLKYHDVKPENSLKLNLTKLVISFLISNFLNTQENKKQSIKEAHQLLTSNVYECTIQFQKAIFFQAEDEQM